MSSSDSLKQNTSFVENVPLESLNCPCDCKALRVTICERLRCNGTPFCNSVRQPRGSDRCLACMIMNVLENESACEQRDVLDLIARLLLQFDRRRKSMSDNEWAQKCSRATENELMVTITDMTHAFQYNQDD